MRLPRLLAVVTLLALVCVFVISVPLQAGSQPLLTLDYTQAKSLHCSDTPIAPYQPTIQNLAPGECVLQKIELHNKGANFAQNISLRILIPQEFTLRPFADGLILHTNLTQTSPILLLTTSQEPAVFTIKLTRTPPTKSITVYLKFQLK